MATADSTGSRTTDTRHGDEESTLPHYPELVLYKLFKNLLSRFGNKIRFATKYVDDSLFYTRNTFQDELLELLNSFIRISYLRVKRKQKALIFWT